MLLLGVQRGGHGLLCQGQKLLLAHRWQLLHAERTLAEHQECETSECHV